MEIILIAAVGRNNEIGKDNKLLWRLPNDMKFFSETTKGHTVVMGRKTYESIPKKFRPLPDRNNIVISSTQNYEDEGVHMAMNFLHSFGIAENLDSEKLFICGGSSLYERGLKFADKILLTEVDVSFDDTDTFFPQISNGNIWNECEILRQDVDDKHKYPFTIYEFSRELV